MSTRLSAVAFAGAAILFGFHAPRAEALEFAYWLTAKDNVVVVASGEFVEGDLEKYTAWKAKRSIMIGREVVGFEFNSLGGDVAVGFAFANWIKANGLTTGVAAGGL